MIPSRDPSVDKHSFTSMDAAGALGAAVNVALHWRVQMKAMDVELVLKVHNRSARVMLPINATTMFKRNIVAFGPTTLRATISHGLCRMAQLTHGDRLLDPMAGSGSIPIEAVCAGCWTDVTGIAGEIHAQGVDNLRANVRASTRADRLWPMMADARHMPLKDASVGRAGKFLLLCLHNCRST